MDPKTFIIKEMKINMQCTYFVKLSNDCWNWPNSKNVLLDTVYTGRGESNPKRFCFDIDIDQTLV